MKKYEYLIVGSGLCGATDVSNISMLTNSTWIC